MNTRIIFILSFLFIVLMTLFAGAGANKTGAITYSNVSLCSRLCLRQGNYNCGATTHWCCVSAAYCETNSYSCYPGGDVTFATACDI